MNQRAMYEPLEADSDSELILRGDAALVLLLSLINLDLKLGSCTPAKKNC